MLISDVGFQITHLKGFGGRRFQLHSFDCTFIGFTPHPFFSFPDNVGEFEGSQEKKATPINFFHPNPFFCVYEVERKQNVFG